MDDFAITISDLYKTFFSNKNQVNALCGVDLKVLKGEIFGFLGPNGAGKTTTLRILTTLMPFDKGDVRVLNVDVKKDPQKVRRNIGYVSQKGGADLHATGFENLILQARLYKISKIDAIKRAEKLVDAFSLKECISRLVETYSGGQKRRLDIALAMIHEPKILFLDEPTNGLDPQSRNNLWSKILELKKNGITIFLTSHYLDEVDALADTLAIMDFGKIVASGKAEVLKKQISKDTITIGMAKHFHEKAISFLESKNSLFNETLSEEKELHLYVDKGAKALPEILRLLDQSKLEFETIHMSSPSLNDVFLKKTGRFLREGSYQ